MQEALFHTFHTFTLVPTGTLVQGAGSCVHTPVDDAWAVLAQVISVCLLAQVSSVCLLAQVSVCVLVPPPGATNMSDRDLDTPECSFVWQGLAVYVW